MSKELTTRRVEGIDLLVREGDPADTVLFLHGIGGRGTTFAPLFAAMPAGPRLVAWDAPGYGTSTPLTSSWPLAADYAMRLEDLRLALRLNAFTLVGHSLGCLIGGAYAARHADRLSKLVLMAPALGYQVPHGATADIPVGVAARIADVERLGPVAFAAARAPNLVHDAATHAQTVEFVRDAMSAINQDGYAQAAHMLASGDLIADAAAIRTPTLVINGAHDKVTPPDNARQLVAALAVASTKKLAIVEAAGHALSIEQPALIATTITDFLREAP